MEDTLIDCPHCGAKNRLKAVPSDQVPICGKCRNPLPWLINGTDISFRKELGTTTPVLVDFWAQWCAPCRITTPVLELARERPAEIKVVKINVDENPTTAGQYNVRSIPTLILFKEGHPVETLVGAMSKDALVQRLSPHLA